MRRAIASVALAVTLAVAAPPAASAAPAAAAPAGAATVAGPLASGARLVAFDRGPQLCLEVVRPRGPGGGPSCGPPPVALGDVRVQQEYGPAPTWHYAAVPSDVAAVELVLAGGRTLRAPTTAGEAYRGAASGRVRFFFAESPGNDQVRLTRLLDAGGRVVFAREDPFAELGRKGLPQGARRLAAGRAGSVRWRAYAYERRRLEPTPIEPEHYRRYACVVLRRLGSTVVFAGDGTCVPRRYGLDGASLRVGLSQDCAGTDVTGLVAPRVRSVAVVGGDGRRLRVATHALPARLGALRGFAAVVRPGVALRRVVGLDAAGRGVAARQIGLAPANAGCRPPRGGELGTSGGFFAVGSSGDGGRRHVGPDDPVLVARDAGDELCVAPGRLRPGYRDCALPPVGDPFDSVLVGAHAPGRTLLAGVTSTDVDAVELVLDRGQRLVVPTTTDVPYAGRYAGHVRFVAVELPGRRYVLRARTHARGRWSLAFAVGLDPPPSRPVTLLARGAARLVAQRVPGYPRAATCVRVTACVSRTIATASVLCGPGAGTYVAGLAGPGVRRVVAVLADGRRVRARVVRVPAGFPSRPRAWLVALGREQALRRVVGVGRGGWHAYWRLPAASRQCGYSSFAALLSPRFPFA